MPPKFNVNARTITAPLAAFCMASILFVYSRTSIQAAKRNAQKHREADGGEINWHNESLRRHGKLESPDDYGALGQILDGLRGQKKDAKEVGVKKVVGGGETEEEKKIRERAGRRPGF